MKRLIAFVALSLGLVALLAVAHPVHAAGGTATGCNGITTLGTPGLNIDCTKSGGNPIYGLLQTVINWLVRLLIVGATIMVVVSGIQYIVSQGNPEGIKNAKNRLTNAIVGLILLSLMFVILHILGIG